MATRFSSNTFNRQQSINPFTGGLLSLAPTKLVSSGTGEPNHGIDSAQFDSGKGQRRDPNLGFLLAGKITQDSPSPKSKRLPSNMQLENVIEEEPDSPRAANSDPRDGDPDSCPEVIDAVNSNSSRNDNRVPKKQLSAKSDVETKLEADGLRLRDSELDEINEARRSSEISLM